MIEHTTRIPSSWDAEADLVVVGTGGAGLTAAVVAALDGAIVIAVEKTSLVGGTTSVSGGGVWIPMNHHMAEVGVDDSREEALAYLRGLAGEAAEEEMLTALVDNGSVMVSYLEDRAGVHFRPWPAIGGTIDYRPEVPGAKHGGRPLDPGKVALADLGDWTRKLRTGPSSPWVMDKLEYFSERMHTLPREAKKPSKYAHTRSFIDVGAVEYHLVDSYDHVGAGAALVAQLLRACLAAGVVVLTDTPAHELIVENGRVIGLKAGHEGADFFLRADVGVLLATGGYANDEALKRAFLNRPLEYTCELKSNTGDGHRMGMAIGAQLSHLGDAWWGPMVPLLDDATPHTNAMMIREARSLPHTLMVNRRGRRFVNESMNYYDIVEAFGSKQGLENVPCWMIFDSQAYDNYTMFPGAPPPVGDKPSWLIEAESIDVLAKAIGISPQALELTIDRFNSHAVEGIDPDYDRGKSRWDIEWGDPSHRPNPSLGPVNTPPFYAVELRPGALATKGGLRINPLGQVLSVGTADDPIPGLYAAGNVSSGAVPYAYPGPGATIGAAMTFGFIVGRQIGQKVLGNHRAPSPSNAH